MSCWTNSYCIKNYLDVQYYSVHSSLEVYIGFIVLLRGAHEKFWI